MTERLVQVHRAMMAAPADGILESLAECLTRLYPITEVQVLLVDYRLAMLLPLGDGVPATKPGDPAWRCFDHQAATPDGPAVHLPVTTRGERVGVMRVSPEPEDAGDLAELAEIATMLAHEMQAARASTDRYTVAARSRRLTLAAEMQWELLPGRSRIRPSFSLAGQLEPAYAVRGDTFDWAEADGCLYLTVLNGMGEGMTAALLSSLATYALRNARRAGLGLADQAALADQAVYAQHRGAQHVSALMLELELRTGVLRVVDAGSPRMLLLRDGEVFDEELTAQFPLGMFESSDYRTQDLALSPGDRVMIVSDGVFDAPGRTGPYGEAALRRFVRQAGSRAPLQAVRSLIGDLQTYLAGTDLDDDAVAVCLDWTGPR